LKPALPQALVLLGALAIDACLGEPTAWLHPVVLMGRGLDWLAARAPVGDRTRLVYGTLVAVAMPLAWGLVGRWIERTCPWPVQAIVLKSMFAGRSLLGAAQRVERDLRADQLAEARADLFWLVSRPTSDLDAPRVAAAAIESLAENFVDSWVAPLLAYASFGLSGACAYRALNTADAMWGYRTPPYEYLGKASARLDDLANFLPARLGGLLLILVGADTPADRESRSTARRVAAWTIVRRDASRTASPNAGQPMAVMAGLLDVRLEKLDHYVLHARGRLPGADDLAHAGRVVCRAMMVTAAACTVGIGLRRP
jgi:adenosylcobinamide-phosphate synthase